MIIKKIIYWFSLIIVISLFTLWTVGAFFIPANTAFNDANPISIMKENIQKNTKQTKIITKYIVLTGVTITVGITIIMNKNRIDKNG